MVSIDDDDDDDRLKFKWHFLSLMDTTFFHFFLFSISNFSYSSFHYRLIDWRQHIDVIIIIIIIIVVLNSNWTQSNQYVAYSTNGKFETLSTTHQINVICKFCVMWKNLIFHFLFFFLTHKDPPEMPILLGVKNGQVTVFVGEIFKCKCVCYGGNPRANLIWLNQNDREVWINPHSYESGTTSIKHLFTSNW